MSTARKLKEEEFLEKCFALLSRYSHDKLKELLEKEKEDQKTHSSLLWSSFLHLMMTFADLDKHFYSFVFMTASNFGARILGKREPTLKTRYSCLLTELRKVEGAHRDLASSQNDPKTDAPVSFFQNLEQLVSVVGGQLQHFVVARMHTISFYEQLPALTDSRNVSIEDLLKIINSTLEEFLCKTHQSLICCLKETYKMECEIVINLLKTQVHLQKCQYMESLMSLSSASKSLTAWNAIFSSKEVKKLTFVNSSNKAWVPDLLEWLSKFKGLLLSKFNLYFFEVLCQSGGNPSEVRNNIAKAPIDFYARITSFYKKADAYKIYLVLTNLNELEESSRRQGYFFQGALNFLPKDSDQSNLQQSSSSSGLNISPQPGSAYNSINAPNDKLVVFEYPSEKQEKHQSLGACVSTLFEHLGSRSSELDQLDKIICIPDPSLQRSYVMMKIEGSIHLVTILNKRYVKPDTYVVNFYSLLSSDLRCHKLFVSLKQGSK